MAMFLFFACTAARITYIILRFALPLEGSSMQPFQEGVTTGSVLHI